MDYFHILQMKNAVQGQLKITSKRVWNNKIEISTSWMFITLYGTVENVTNLLNT